MAASTTKQDNLALARRLFKYFAEGQIDRFIETLDPEIVAHQSIDGGPILRGRDAVVEWWTKFSTEDRDIEPRMLDFELAGNCVIIRGYLRHREGRVLSERQVFWLYEFRDGLVVRMESHPTRNIALAACS